MAHSGLSEVVSTTKKSRTESQELLRLKPDSPALRERLWSSKFPGLDTYRYRYCPLSVGTNSIRLVKIHRDLSNFGFLRCSLRRATIKDATFQCLSYRWGPSYPSHTIMMGGDREPGQRSPSYQPFSVSSNLYNFLYSVWRLQRGLDPISSEALGQEFWIDALCINQDDPFEKGHQVAQMAQIYASASRVIVWLGPFKKALQLRKSNGTTMWSQFSSNGYWKRAWIVQEIVLAREVFVFLGNILVPFGQLVSVFDSSTLPARIYAWHRTTSQDRASAEELRLLSILDDFPDQEASIPRDRIFSMLGLIREASRVVVDYKSANVDVAHQILQACGSEHCFCSVLLILTALGTWTDLYYWCHKSPYIKITLSDYRSDRCEAYDKVHSWLECLLPGSPVSKTTMMAYGIDFVVKPSDPGREWKHCSFIIRFWSPLWADLSRYARLCDRMKEGRPWPIAKLDQDSDYDPLLYRSIGPFGGWRQTKEAQKEISDWKEQAQKVIAVRAHERAMMPQIPV